MTDDPRAAPKKLEAFLEGETSAEESRRLIAWIQSQPDWNADSIWDKVAATIDEDQVRPRLHASSARRIPFSSRGRRRASALAAAIVFAVVGGVWWYFDAAPAEAPPAVARTYRTERGQRA